MLHDWIARYLVQFALWRQMRCMKAAYRWLDALDRRL
jgi:hypothetical protein